MSNENFTVKLCVFYEHIPECLEKWFYVFNIWDNFYWDYVINIICQFFEILILGSVYIVYKVNAFLAL